MKRIITLMLAAGLMLGASSAAQAVDINMSGMYDFTAQWGNASFQKDRTVNKNGSGSNNAFYQRFRTQIDITASEALSGVVFLEIGDVTWGQSNTQAGRGAGGGIGGDGVSIEVRRAYLDWIMPNTDLKIRMGLQGFVAPNLTGGGSMVFNDDVAGISMAYQFNPTVGATAWWFRPYANNTVNNDGSNKNHSFTKLDMIGLSVPLTFDGVKVTPWGQYARIGRDIMDGYKGPTSAPSYTNGLLPSWAPQSNMSNLKDGEGNGWWLGLTGDVTVWNPFRLAWDLNYGSVDMGELPSLTYGKGAYQRSSSIDMKRSGWILSLLAEYKLDFGTPGLVLWYGSGDDDDVRNGSEMMPSIKSVATYTSFGQDGQSLNFMSQTLATSLAGSWGVVAQIKDMSFVQDLKHTFRVAYYRGTNDKDMAVRGYVQNPFSAQFQGSNAGDASLYLTEKDSAWEVNLDNTYDIYKNLQLGVELGYIKLDLSKDAWGKAIKDKEEDGYKIGVGLRYTF